MLLEIVSITLVFAAIVVLAWPLGKYIAAVYAGERHWSDRVFGPLERLSFRLSGIDPSREMTWQEHLRTLLTINVVWFFWSMFVLMNQGWLPWNPDGNPSMTPDLAFNTTASFIVNCNLQHYSGESGLSYFSQIFAIMFFQFVSAGTGMAAGAVVFNAMRQRTAAQLGNFYDYFLKSCTRILLPVSFVATLVLIAEGTPMNLFEGKDTVTTLQGDTVQVSRGPAAAMIAIKQAGTNGGGYFGVNSAHPLENPTALTNAVENILILLIPIAFIFALGFYLKNRRLARVIFGAMTLGFLMILAVTIWSEFQGNPNLNRMGISQTEGSMEGKEVRLGAGFSALWAISTTATSNGSVNAMHDSFTPLGGAMQLLDMMINALYGGVGVGFLNFYIFIILSAFIGGLMVGRTPELLGKKVEAREMKIAMLVALLHPFLILVGTAIAAWLSASGNPMAANWLNNPGYHGFSEMLYEFTSASANNGSGFEGLADNNPFWNISTGIVLLLSRYLPIIGPVAIAGLMAAKKTIPESAGTLRSDSATFGILILTVIFILAALAFFPALALGPLAEHFSF
ncbi:MAG: potassium-transporting ATPase subunit KdpA [Saprospiraceae bacterium]|nr:potassium-transporting ATPase subunit KdpA [Saprospiraceae bacterium]